MSFLKHIFLFSTKQKVTGDLSRAKPFSFGRNSWCKLKANKPALWSMRILSLLVVLVFLAPVLANDKPLYCKYNGQHLFPAFSLDGNAEVIEGTGENKKWIYDFVEWKKLKFESVLWAPCAYSPGKSDIVNSDGKGPFHQQAFLKSDGSKIVIPTKFKHWLGCSKNGSDLLSGLIHGIKISLVIGILSMLIAGIIGVALGSMAGYFGDKKMKTKRGVAISLSFGLILAYFYGFYIRTTYLKDALSTGGSTLFLQLLLSIVIFTTVLLVFYLLGKKISRLPFFSKLLFVPVDSIVSRLVEIMNSLPLFMLIISISAISTPSFFTLILIIGFTTWAGIARLMRAEFLRISTLDYIQAAKSLGLTELRIMFKHAMPNAIAPVSIQIAFGIAGAILIESALSFLGVGVPPEIVTWGSLLSEARDNFSAWWMVLFPGLMIFLTVTIYNLIGEGLRDALDPRLKN